MINNLPSLQVAVADHSAVVRINGRANFTTSVSFKHLVGELRQRGFEKFILDLSHCVTMDSTFLGVLAGTALKLSETGDGFPRPDLPEIPASRQLRLLNPNQRVADLLDNLGVSELFRMVHCNLPASTQENLTPTEEANPSHEELSQTCLEAHLLLMEINPGNIPKFKDVAQFLAEDLKRLSADRANHAEEPGPTGKKPVECP